MKGQSARRALASVVGHVPASTARALRCLALTVLVVGLLAPALEVISIGAAGASPGAAGWSIQPSPNEVIPNGNLAAISCSSTIACTAVGASVDGATAIATGGQIALAEGWNGKTWGVQKPLNPANYFQVDLQSVSCAAATSCVAVGNYVNNSNTETLLTEVLGGSAWKIEAAAVPKGAFSSSFAAVSCVAANSCIAVGTYTTSSATSEPLAEAWNGTVWKATSVAGPAGGFLTGVGCYVGGCIAVGGYDKTASLAETLAEIWNGSTWKVQPTPNVAGSPYTIYTGISCTAAKACVAVGESTSTKSVGTAVSAVWGGSFWAAKTVAAQAGAADSGLAGVSCLSATDCLAVGQFTKGSAGLALSELWTGTAWKLEGAPDPAGTVSSELAGVSCKAIKTTDVCVAVGHFRNSTGDQMTLGEQWSGSSWKLQAPADASLLTFTNLTSVSCASSSECLAVGWYTSLDGGQSAFAESWTGKVWTVSTPDDPPGALGVQLYGVSCNASDDCMAVGDYESGSVAGGDLPLAETWSQSGWKTVSPPEASADASSTLDGVSCVSTDCMAVGGYTPNGSSTQLNLAYLWNGSAWTLESAPSPTGASGASLDGVSCVTGGACDAVGGYSDSSGAQAIFAEQWSGSAWTEETTPLPSSAEDPNLSGISCTSETACVADGTYNDSSSLPQQLAESWSGTAWTTLTTAVPMGSNSSQLAAVACSAASTCTAVGSYTTPTTQLTMASALNRSVWGVQPTPNPTGGEDPDLSSVACTSGTVCTAIGSFDSNAGVSETLVEVESQASVRADVPSTGSATTPPVGTFQSVSCVSATACMAVGYGPPPEPGGGVTAMSEWWNGKTWTVEKTLQPTGAEVVEVVGVSCAAVNFCILVGNYLNVDEDTILLSELWNGSAWKILPVVFPKNIAGDSELDGVSCSRVNSCVAVGWYETSTGDDDALVETWTGTWAVDSNPAPVNAKLAGVSCSAPTACTAVGSYPNSTESKLFSLAEALTGSVWKVQATPNASGADGTVLTGVSCTSAQMCMAVGDGMESAFAAWWDGKVWAPVKVSPLPAGATDSSLAGVSCEARTVCTLVGAYGKANGELFTLAQSWNGKTLGASEKVPSPTGAVESNPGGVSCKTAAFCLAAGGSETPTTESPLALRESGTTWSLVDPTSTTPPKALRCHESAYGQCQQLRCPRSRKPS